MESHEGLQSGRRDSLVSNYYIKAEKKNSPAYYGAESITTVTSFIVQAHDGFRLTLVNLKLVFYHGNTFTKGSWQ
jgi:hypothetical protein